MFRPRTWVVLLSLLAAPVVAQDTPPAAETQTQTPKPRRITYTPPDRGAPVTRVGSGTRGPEGKLPLVELLAPRQAGLTASRRPTLYWFLSDPTDVDVVITLTDLRTRETVLDRVERGPKRAGIHRIRIEDRMAELTPGHSYRLVILVDADKSGDENDPAMTAILRCTDPLPPSPAANDLSTLAEKGLWYDTLALLNAQIESNPNDATLKQLRADLIRQEQLNLTAAWDQRPK